MGKMTGGQYIARFLEAQGVEYVFGMAGHTNLAVLDGLSDTKVQYVSVRHEQVATHAADAYFRVTHKPGVALLHMGPGMTNGVTGVATGALDSSAMVIIAGDVPSYMFGKDPHQEIKYHADGSQWEIYRPFVKKAWRLHDPNMLEDILSRAFNLAVSGRPGPVFIDVPMDYLSRPVDLPIPDASLRRPRGRILGDPAEIDKALDLLLAAKQPCIYAGGGVILSDAHTQLRQFVKSTGIPLATTMMGKGVFPEDDNLCFGITGVFGSPIANRLTKEADVILAVGTRFPEMDSSSWIPGQTFNIPPTKLIHIDIDNAEIGKIYPAVVGIQGDAGAVLQQFVDALAERRKSRSGQPNDQSARVKDLRSAYKAWFAEKVGPYQQSNAIPIRPERILYELRKALPRDGIILTDVGWNKNGAAQQFPIYEPRTQLAPGGLATMGFGPAAAVGAKAGAPDKPVVALVGDGAFGSTCPAVATAVEYGLGVTWVVMNNYSFGVIYGMQKNGFGRAYGTEFVQKATGKPYNPDYAKMAESYGAHGYRVEDPKQLGPILTECIKRNEPAVLDVIMDKTVGVPRDGIWDVNTIYKRYIK
ncbi:MAG: thiamine pyrophosphate-binding protein [bacterium]